MSSKDRGSLIIRKKGALIAEMMVGESSSGGLIRALQEQKREEVALLLEMMMTGGLRPVKVWFTSQYTMRNLNYSRKMKSWIASIWDDFCPSVRIYRSHSECQPYTGNWLGGEDKHRRVLPGQLRPRCMQSGEPPQLFLLRLSSHLIFLTFVA